MLPYPFSELPDWSWYLIIAICVIELILVCATMRAEELEETAYLNDDSMRETRCRRAKRALFVAMFAVLAAVVVIGIFIAIGMSVALGSVWVFASLLLVPFLGYLAYRLFY